MHLTDHEKNLIARRAAGEYATIPQLRRLVTEHRKNRILEDQVFLEFARLALKSSWSRDDYREKSQAVLDIIPEPWGTPWTKLEGIEVVPAKRRRQSSKSEKGAKKKARKRTEKAKKQVIKRQSGAAGLMDLMNESD